MARQPSSARRRGSRTRSLAAELALVVGFFVVAALAVVVVGCSEHDLRGEAYPVRHLADIEASAARHDVDPYLVCAVIKCESGWDEGAASQAGAVGLMQVMPETAQTLAGLGYVDADAYPPRLLAEPRVNVEYGCACLEYLSDQLETTDEVVAAYNAGLGTVLAWKEAGGDVSEVMDYPETSAYLVRVREALRGYQDTYSGGLTER